MDEILLLAIVILSVIVVALTVILFLMRHAVLSAKRMIEAISSSMTVLDYLLLTDMNNFKLLEKVVFDGRRFISLPKGETIILDPDFVGNMVDYLIPLQVDEKDKKAGILVGIIRKEGKEEIFTPIFTVADVKRILMEKNLVNLLAEKMDKSLEDVKKQISEALEKELKIISQLRSLNVEKIAFLIGKLSARSDTILQQVALGYAEESGEEVFNIQQFKDRLKEALEILQIGAEEEEE